MAIRRLISLQPVREPVERLLTGSFDQLARSLSDLAGTLPDRHVRQLMRSPARRPIVESIFWLMPRYLNRTRTRGLYVAVRWRVKADASDTEPDIYDVVIADGRCRVLRGASGPPPLATITLEAAELLLLATGRSNAMQAYFAGRLGLRGDIVQAAQLTTLFRIPTARQAPAATAKPRNR